MAVELLGAGNDRLDFGDIASVDSLTEISVAFSIKPASGGLVGNRLISKWGSTSAKEQIISQLVNTDEIGFFVTKGGTGTANGVGRQTNATNPLVAGTLIRVVFRWKASPKSIDIWVNGVNQSVITWIANATPVDLGTGSTNLQVGHETDETSDGVDGDYSEIAIWDHKIPDNVAIAYGKGFSPLIYPKGGLVYCRALNSSHLVDEWGGNTVTPTGAADAPHPAVYYPRRPSIITAPAAAPGGSSIPVISSDYRMRRSA